jgi:glycosyltransferase involved in cell wall biosynthesis
MKIGMMADTYKPHVSGITNYISLNKRFIEAMGHEIYIFTFGDEKISDDETNVIRSPGLPLIDTGYYLSLRYNREARKLLQSMDIVHVHHPFLSGSLSIRYCRPENIPIVFTNHTRYDLYTQAYLPILPDAVGETAMRASLPPFCRLCDLVIAPSKGMAKVLERIGVDTPIQVVPNGVELEPFHQEIQPLDRAQFGIDKDAVLLIYVGRLGPEKNLPFLLRAFGGVSEAFENVNMMLVGDGSENDNLQALVKHMGLTDKVVFTGMVPYPEIPKYLRMADIFTTASITEVHPLSVIEAMAASLPVLGITSPGIADSIQDGVTGYLSSNNLASFTAKMVRMVADVDKCKELGRMARYNSEDFSIRRTTKIMVQKYEDLLRASKTNQRGMRFRINQFLRRIT